jgi:glucoamylase
VTTQGDLVPGITRHYIRIHPTDINDRSPDENPNRGVITISNRPPGEPFEFPAKSIVDAGFLELVRYGVRKPGDPLVEDSLAVVDAVLKADTPYGPCWRRYNHDGYGPRDDGSPYDGWGRGRLWPILTGERAHYELAKHKDVSAYVKAIEGFASKGGMLPEQVWDRADIPERDQFFGRAAGSAMPLMWAHAEYIKLLRSIYGGDIYDCMAVVSDRYRSGKGRKDLEIWKPIRQVRQVERGSTLRIEAPLPFRLHWTVSEWHPVTDTGSIDTGFGIHYVDVPVAMDQRAPVRFTFFWTSLAEWEGCDYRVDVI